MELGPFKTEIKRSLNVDVEGLDELNIYPESDDIKLMRLMLDDEPSEDRYLSDANLVVEWSVTIGNDDAGIFNVEANFIRVTGTLTIEDLPVGADPNTYDGDLEEFKFEIDSDKMKLKLLVDENFNDVKLGDGVYPSEVALGLSTKGEYQPYAKLSFWTR